MRFYWLRPPKVSRYSGELNAAHRWGLPGVHCPLCGATWGGGDDAYPCADLSGLAERTKLEEPRLEEDFEEYQRLRELVRPLVPEGAPVGPGTGFGPLVGTARGKFAPLHMPYPWMLLSHTEALARLQAEGVRGLTGCLTALRFRQKQPPELLELQIVPHGLLHPDCLPPGKAKPCVKCGRYDFSRPEEPVLDESSLPANLDLFRLANFQTMIIGSERLADAVRRMGFEEVIFLELPLR